MYTLSIQSIRKRNLLLWNSFIKQFRSGLARKILINLSSLKLPVSFAKPWLKVGGHHAAHPRISREANSDEIDVMEEDCQDIENILIDTGDKLLNINQNSKTMKDHANRNYWWVILWLIYGVSVTVAKSRQVTLRRALLIRLVTFLIDWKIISVWPISPKDLAAQCYLSQLAYRSAVLPSTYIEITYAILGKWTAFIVAFESRCYCNKTHWIPIFYMNTLFAFMKITWPSFSIPSAPCMT